MEYVFIALGLALLVGLVFAMTGATRRRWREAFSEHFTKAGFSLDPEAEHFRATRGETTVEVLTPPWDDEVLATRISVFAEGVAPAFQLLRARASGAHHPQIPFAELAPKWTAYSADLDAAKLRLGQSGGAITELARGTEHLAAVEIGDDAVALWFDNPITDFELLDRARATAERLAAEWRS
ncbi:MAG: hypothetical protein U0271_29270 [Polyangiaceae bacterium]